MNQQPSFTSVYQQHIPELNPHFRQWSHLENIIVLNKRLHASPTGLKAYPMTAP
jgi:hypothetical protein